MPIKGARYRYTKSGVRLAFKGNTVVEAKNTDTGATHTPAEFAADRKKRKLPKRGSGELTPLGSRTLAGYQEKWGTEPGHAKFEAAIESGVLSHDRMMKNKRRDASARYQKRGG